MSKLAKLITATMTGDVRAVRDINLRYIKGDMSVSADVSQYATHGISKVCRIGVTIDKQIMLRNEDAVTESFRDIKRAILEEVFGEFRPYLIEMRAALYEEDTTRLRALIAEVEEQMFTDGI